MTTLVGAINEALHDALERDSRVMVMGEDVGVMGGVFRATAGLRDRFGAERCVDTPLAEAGIIGTAVGLALSGWRPVCEMQFDAFSYPALDQIINHVGRYRARSGGHVQMHLVVRIPYGGGLRAPEMHQDSPEAYYAHIPGIKVVVPATPSDAKALLHAAIDNPDPVIFLEPKRLYRTAREEIVSEGRSPALGEARVVAVGDDVTLIAYGAMVPVAMDARERLSDDGIAAEVIDLRTLTPLDEQAILHSVAKTGRVVVIQEAPRTCGFAAEVVALVADLALFDLRAPVRRVTAYDIPYPVSSLENAYLPSVARVIDVVGAIMDYT